MRGIFIILFVGTLCFAKNSYSIESIDSLRVSNIHNSANLNAAFKKLFEIKAGLSKKKFVVLHFGDSHVQAGHFSGQIRRNLQSEFGNAGQGIIFPYTLCKSFSPKGILAQTTGQWNCTNLLKFDSSRPIGIKGYVLGTQSTGGTLSFNITSEYAGNKTNKISIWSSCDSVSHNYTLGDSFRLIEQYRYNESIQVRTYELNSQIDSFRISVIPSGRGDKEFLFHGFEYVPDALVGVDYHQLGVVGACFTHLVRSDSLVFEQIGHIQPDLIIFSYGSNESYDVQMDTTNYYNKIHGFLAKIKNEFPQTAVLITTAPDTRSENRTPKYLLTVNRLLKIMAADLSMSVYDLNEAMGGWGSAENWYKQDFMLKDKLHFNSKGYKLQGSMLCFDLFQLFNEQAKGHAISVDELSREINLMLPRPEQANPLEGPEYQSDGSGLRPVKNQTTGESTRKKVNYIVKKGDTITSIARKHRADVSQILKINGLKENTIIRPGQSISITR